MILILTRADDPHADHVEERLRQRGANFMRFKPRQFPSSAAISLELSSGGQARYTLRHGQESIDLNCVTAVWYRRPEQPVPHAEITDTVCREYVEAECKAFAQDAWDCLNCRWLPAPFMILKRAEQKAFQLKLAGELGFELPPTLFTNNPEDFLDFYCRHDRIVSKLAGTSFFGSVYSKFARYTEVVSTRDVGYAESVRYCPLIFQAYVPKRLELRITVVGQVVFAAEIHSQQSNHTRHDWRRYDPHKTAYFPHELPPDVESRCVELVARLGLCYGAIDLVLTPDGRYVFLEINPNGQYLWIEHATSLPITDAICDLLMADAAVENSADNALAYYQGEWQ
jgi:hypothetical protein